MKKERTCILVLGMHRSGSSALTGALGLLGATLPAKQLGSTTDNVKGHFEPLLINTVNKQLLFEMNTCWYDFSSLDALSADRPIPYEFRNRLVRAIHESFGDAKLFVLKDPRLCRLVPLIRSALQEAHAAPHAILCFRNPVEVAYSLRARNGISISHGLGLWLRYVLEAELHTRGLPRTFVDFSDLLNDWESTMACIENQLGISLPKRTADDINKVNTFLDNSLCHQQGDFDELQISSEWDTWIKTTYEKFGELVHEPQNSDATKALDKVHALFDQSASFFGPVVKEYFSELSDTKQTLSSAKFRPHDHEALSKYAERWKEQHRINSESQASALELLTRKQRTKEARLKQHLREIRAQAEQLKHEIRKKDARLNVLEDKLNAFSSSTAWRLMAPLRNVISYVRKFT